MKQLHHLSRKTLLLTFTIALLHTLAFNAQGKGKGFKDVVNHLETKYRAKKVRIPLLGLANFAVKIVRPAGVKGFKLAVFENQDFTLREGDEPFEVVMRTAYDKEWQPLVRVTSKRGGHNRVLIYSRNAGKDVQFALLVLEAREAVVLEVKFNPDAAVRFLENPKIMGISIGNSIRGNKNAVANQPTQNSNADKNANPVSPSTEVASGSSEVSEPKPSPPLSASVKDDNNPPIPGVEKTEARPVEIKTVLPDRNAIRIETRLVNLNVKALNRGGQPLTDLKPEEFSIYEDGLKQEISHFRPVDAPVNLIMLLDLSGSTKNKRKAMQEAAKRFVDALPAQDNVAIVAFTRKYRPLTDFTKDKAKLKSVLKDINDISGDTAFYDSMWITLDRLDQLSDARKAIIVLTDGEDDSLESTDPTEHTFEQLLERASEEDVTIYPIYFSPSNHYNKVGLLFGGGNLTGSEKSRIARKQLSDLAEQTGGEIYSAQREEDLEDAYKRVAAELHTLYSLAYSPDKLKHNGEFRKVSIKVSRDGAVARTRRGYYDR
ncbi:MAG: VWA domain-containing protein [Acidobacteria bacterium]|nr:VWA domain-containing protein [Acidobacteriota bacterium]